MTKHSLLGRLLMRFAYLIALLTGAVLIAAPNQLLAYAFDLSETEFRTWPGYCKVVYVRTQVGSLTPYSKFISADDLSSGNAVLGHDKYGDGGVHHLCAGKVWLNRARVEPALQTKNFYLSRARSETQYTLERASTGGYTSVLATTQMAEVLVELGEFSQALSLLNAAIPHSPDNARLYLSIAAIHYRHQEYDSALDILVAGNKNVDGASPDIHYSLGLILIKLGDPLSASEHAYVAYEKGYPLPGLRRQLQQSGHWNPPE